MNKVADDEREERDEREARPDPDRDEENPLDVCDSAHVAETYRLEHLDDACDDGVR